MESTRGGVHSCGRVLPKSMPDRAHRALAARRAASLGRGQHLVLWGPRGSGKTLLMNAVLQELGGAHRALSAATNSLDDITATLERGSAPIPCFRMYRLTRASEKHRRQGICGPMPA